MSREISLFPRLSLIGIALVLEGLVVYLLVTLPPADIGAALLSFTGIAGLGAHMVGAALLAAGLAGFLPGANVGGRASAAALYFVLSFVLPGPGAIGAISLAWVLAKCRTHADEDSEFAVGNPLLKQIGVRGGSPPAVHLDPLVRSTRLSDSSELARMVLGLKRWAHKPGAAAILRRCLSDVDSEVQFYAQSALSLVADKEEQRRDELAGRIARDSGDFVARVEMAEFQIEMAARRGTSSRDRQRLCEGAVEGLLPAIERHPESVRLRRLMARARLELGDLAAARASLSAVDVPQGAPVDELELEILYREGDLARLIGAAANGTSGDPRVSAALSFWRSSNSPRRITA